MSTWLITSFGLPVALTTGRLTALTEALPRHPAGVLVMAVVLSVVTASAIAVAQWRRRRGSQRGSTS
jgi:hypothetical protein